MTDKFKKVMKFILKHEGGYVNHPNDPGGETKYGISKRAHPTLDIANLTLDQALRIYHLNYWLPIRGDDRNYPEALATMDFAVNSGVARALSFWEGVDDLDSYIAARVKFLVNAKDKNGNWAFLTFGRGWSNRIADLIDEVRNDMYRWDVELVQIYLRDQRIEFRPMAVSVGKTEGRKPKIMVRLD